MNLPPSLAQRPNPPIESLTNDELLEEFTYWDDKIKGAKFWGAALSQADRFRKKCAYEMEKRKMPYRKFRSKYDGFIGVQIGTYKRLDGHEGLVLQQDGTKVVHVYGLQSLEEIK